MGYGLQGQQYCQIFNLQDDGKPSLYQCLKASSQPYPVLEN